MKKTLILLATSTQLRYCIAFVLFSVNLSLAQVQTKIVTAKEFFDLFPENQFDSYPTSFVGDLTESEITKLQKEDALVETQGSGAYRFAKLLNTNLNINNSGRWGMTETHLTWGLNIATNSAKSLSLTFENFQMPANAEMYLISANKKVVYGPITAENFPQISEVSTEVLRGNTMTIFYKELKGGKVAKNIAIKQLGYGYREGGESIDERVLPCHVEVTDPRADCFRIEQNAVAMLLENNSTAICTATLINNVGTPLNPFLITANHCTVVAPNNSSINFSNLGVRFRFFQGGQSMITFVGTNQRAATGFISDCSLLELTQTIKPEDKLFFMGWSRNNSNISSTTVLHHSDGKSMKITRNVNPPTNNKAAQTNFSPFFLPANSAWTFDSGDNVTAGDFGALETGASGSALINQNHRIIGDLNGGQEQVCIGSDGSSANKFFGKFSTSWNTGATAATRLQNWLDPANTGTNEAVGSFLLIGVSDIIPCSGFQQDIEAPLIVTNSGVAYTYIWRSSSNIIITGTGNKVKFSANSCPFCTEWIECDIRTPLGQCGSILVATSRRKPINIRFQSNPAGFVSTISPSTNNNGYNVGSYNKICANGTYTIGVKPKIINYLPNGVSLKWTATGSIITSTASNTGFAFKAAAGFTTITCEVIGGTGCYNGYKETFVFEVISSPCSSSLKNPNSGIISAEMVLYPNPANSNIIVNLPNDFDVKNASLEIFDISGKLIKNLVIDDIYLDLNIEQLSSGVYFIRVKNENQDLKQRFVVNK